MHEIDKMRSPMKFLSLIYALIAMSCLTLVMTGCSQEPRQGLRPLAVASKRIVDYAVSPQGVVAFLDGEPYDAGETQLVLVGSNGKPQKIEARIANASLNWIGFSADGDFLIGGNWWGLWIGEIAGDQIKRRVSTKMQKTSFQKYGFLPLHYHIKNGVLSAVSRVGERALKVTRWKVADASFLGEETFDLSREHSLTMRFFVLSADGTKAVVVWDGRGKQQGSEHSPGGYIEIWDIANKQRLQQLESVMPIGLEAPVFSGDAKYVAAVDNRGIGYVWEARTGELMQTLSGLRRKVAGESEAFEVNFISHSFRSASLIFMPDNRTLLAAVHDGHILAYDLESGLPIKILEKRDDYVHPRLSPNNRDILFISNTRELYALPLPNFAKVS